MINLVMEGVYRYISVLQYTFSKYLLFDLEVALD